MSTTSSTTAAIHSSAELSEDELAESKCYARSELLCDLADKVIDVAFLSIMAILIAPHIAGPMLAWFPNDTLRLAGYFVLTTLLHFAVSSPLSYYSGFVLEHQYGLSNQTFGNWLSRYFKRIVITMVFMMMLFIGLYWVIWLFGGWWWLIGAMAFFFVNVLVGRLLPVLVLPLFYKVEKLESQDLMDRFRRLSDGTGLAIEGVYRLDLSSETVKANAMLAGLGHTRRVLLGDTIVNGFTPDEIEVVLAHEVGHHVHRHTNKMMLAGVLTSAAGFWLCDRVVMAWAEQFEPWVTHATLPTFTLPMMMLVLTLFAMFLEPLQNMISRYFERQCDWYALQRTGNRAAYISAFRKLARLNKDDPDPNPWEVFFFHSHPSIGERLAMAERE